MYDEVDMNETISYGIYVNDDRHTWYDENTRNKEQKDKKEQKEQGERKEQDDVIESIYQPKHESVLFNQQKGEIDPPRIYTKQKERFISADTNTNIKLILFLIILAVLYLIHMTYELTSKVNGVLLMQSIMLQNFKPNS
jgi:hypothetical protein